MDKLCHVSKRALNSGICIKILEIRIYVAASLNFVALWTFQDVLDFLDILDIYRPLLRYLDILGLSTYD